ncbi:MAG: DNA-processing protein DprA [Gammaproteobacteria bacterium]|nr:DNA-processing protein DprA [Gammaproteobacteria bacterium]MDH3450125.1 DNA-processing protein DprA [Gammaproteobacteria bacterium]
MQKDLLPDFLHLYHGLGPHRTQLARLLEHFDNDPACARRCASAELGTIGLKQNAIFRIKAGCEQQVARDLAWAEGGNNHLICFDDSAYPALLRQIGDYPMLLYARGNPALLQDPHIAIVGSRLCTPGGAQTAFDFAAELAGAGLAIASGLALGIDAEAHRGALHAGGRTLAVLGTGLDLTYPTRNHRLAEEIAERGLLITEFALGTPARRHNFPQRNRIISGIAMATLVVEAARRSGSLITARLAAEQGREVFAVPGSIHNPLARGCHHLIRDGATLVEKPADVTRELANLLGYVAAARIRPQEKIECDLDREHRDLLETIGYDPVDCDILVQRSGLTIDKLSSMLLLLEFNDLIRPVPGGCFVRI